ncbi:MAG TPA: hypothetical protein DCX89_04555 [Saprospirales bacterium]|nr:hypothetical protein [Saprospirales bacterium]HAY71139.1 hypothetical protein [Saprospirales bacterium]HRQ28866.1 Yip1 family protein [Saprospiraceae bacterium]
MEQIINKVKRILLLPKLAWEEIGEESITWERMLSTYLIPLILIGAIASFIGYGLIGVSMGSFGYSSSISWGVGQAISFIVSALAGIFISGWIISILAPNFNTQVSFHDGIKLAGYAFTPYLVTAVVYILPDLAPILILGGIYSLYHLYLGFKPVTKVSDEKHGAYFGVSLIVMIVVAAIAMWILLKLMLMFGLSRYN